MYVCVVVVCVSLSVSVRAHERVLCGIELVSPKNFDLIFDATTFIFLGSDTRREVLDGCNIRHRLAVEAILDLHLHEHTFSY